MYGTGTRSQQPLLTAAASLACLPVGPGAGLGAFGCAWGHTSFGAAWPFSEHQDLPPCLVQQASRGGTWWTRLQQSVSTEPTRHTAHRHKHTDLHRPAVKSPRALTTAAPRRAGATPPCPKHNARNPPRCPGLCLCRLPVFPPLRPTYTHNTERPLACRQQHQPAQSQLRQRSQQQVPPHTREEQVTSSSWSCLVRPGASSPPELLMRATPPSAAEGLRLPTAVVFGKDGHKGGPFRRGWGPTDRERDFPLWEGSR